MEVTNNNGSNGNGSKFLTGLMWGAIIGGGLVFLLGTKKGKRIIKMLSEEGLELSELLGEGEEDEVEEVIVPSKKVPETNGVKNTTTIEKIASAPRRFFKGVPKR